MRAVERIRARSLRAEQPAPLASALRPARPAGARSARAAARAAAAAALSLALLLAAAAPASLARAATDQQPAAPQAGLDTVAPESSGGLLGLRASHTRQLSVPLPADQRFDMQNFLPVSQMATDVAAATQQSRVAGYTFLRSLSTPVLRAAVGQSPSRDYAQIQRQLALQQQQEKAALLGQGDLAAVLFGMGAPGDSSPVSGVTYLTPAQVAAITGWQTGKASWYGPGFYGHHTADGTTYTATILLVANKTLPLGTNVAISYGGRTVIAPVKDRGPYVAGRDFDLSAGLASALGFSGVQTIRWAIVP
ncbi:MAG: septal ring lytic transglycosylase RlpA family protein [Coriobacteriia bacterium]|nr:septal ring lytic transglycosylase RlpA family protein [Coriobacteriia bacterium]